jgi:TetR/AcrR family transcriptional repressor of nem operon
MRRSREDAAATRQAIVCGAARLFRARGIDAVSVADVMSDQGLTVGGFYRHFEDKDQLVAEAIECASAEALAGHAESRKLGRPADIARMMFERYLSPEHCAHPEAGCPVASLCTQVVHATPKVRAAFTRAINELLAVAAVGMPGARKRDQKRRLHAVSAMVGALVLARATDDETLALELLGSVRRQLVEAAQGDARPRPRRLDAKKRRAAPRRRAGR